MNVSIGKRWEEYLETLMKTGRYGSASEIVREGLRLVEEREAKLVALRETVEASLARGGENDDDAISQRLEQVAEQLMSQGF
jgi:antitoxin ParD1/3/4